MERDLNLHVDALEGSTLVFKGEIKLVIRVNFVSVLSYKTRKESIFCNKDLRLRWMDQIIDFLRHDKLQEDKREAHKLRTKATHFWISPTGNLYKNYYLMLYLYASTQV